MTYRCLKECDGRKRTLLSDWEKWLRSADKFYSRFLDRIGDSPFAYHEVASVGFLASAAALAGFLPMNEYEIIKRGAYDRRTKGDGRADLWFDGSKRCYSFEAKRAWLAATKSNLEDVLESAHRQIRRVDRSEFHDAAGLVIARVRDVHRTQIYEAFAVSSAVDLAYRIGPDGENGTYLFFKLVEN